MLATSEEWSEYKNALANRDIDAALAIFFAKKRLPIEMHPLLLLINTVFGSIDFCSPSLVDSLSIGYSGTTLSFLKSLRDCNYPLQYTTRHFLVELDANGNAISSATNLERDDAEYSRLLFGKNLHVIGPCSVCCDFTDDDDAIVVHVNKPSASHLHSFLRAKHILYLNGTYIQALEEQRLFEPREIERFNCISLKRPSKALKKRKLPIRHFPNLQVLRFGSSTILTAIVYDLLHYRFNSLKLTGFTLYANGFEYSTSYQALKTRDKDSRGLLDTFEDHDPLSNFSFLKLLFRQGVINCDRRLSAILSMKHRDYLHSVFESMLS